MFSSDVQTGALQPVALANFNSIRDICVELATYAEIKDFFAQPTDEIKTKANDFVLAFSKEAGLTVHTVRPLSWSFAIDNQKMFEDGLIELVIFDNGIACFSYVDVSDAKITDPNSLNQTELFSDKNVIDIYEVQLDKLRGKLDTWKASISRMQESSGHDLSDALMSLEAKLNQLKNNTTTISLRAIRELEILWNEFEKKIDKVCIKIRQ